MTFTNAEPVIRLGCFGGVLLLMALWEVLAPRRRLTVRRPWRWFSNLGLVALDTLTLRFLAPLGVVGVALWAEGFDAWCSAWLGRGAEPPAIVFLRVPGKTESKLRQARVPIPGDAPPVCTDLVRVSGGGTIPKEHVKVLSDLRDVLTVKLIDLAKLHYPPAEGQYLGLVYVDERPIAVIHALVTH